MANWEFRQTFIYFSLSSLILIFGAGIFYFFWSKYFIKEEEEQNNEIINDSLILNENALNDEST